MMPDTVVEERRRNRSRRTRLSRVVAVATAAAALGTVLVAQAPTASTAATRDYFPVPDAAMVRSLGDIPHGPCSPPPKAQVCQGATPSAIDAAEGNFPLSVPGLGVPLGGAGAGAFMINQSGTFGPWNFGGQQDTSWETRILPQAAFHVREQLGSDQATVRTLATQGPQNVGTSGPVAARSWGSPLPAWNTLNTGDADYATLYPFGWMSYKPFKTDVSMRFFSPIVAGEDKRTSLPLAYFDVRIANHTTSPANMSVMFTMPNAPAHVSGTQTDPTVGFGPNSVRTGFNSRYTNANGVQAVTLSADDPGNTPDAANSEWTIAAMPTAGQKVSYVTSWNANGDGSDVYAPFVNGKGLPNGAIDSSASAGAISVQTELAPGQVATIPFALAWDFPQVGFANNQTIWMKRYTDFYGAQETASNDYIAGSYPGHQSFAIARDALLDHDAALAAVQRWWSPLATDPAYPQLLRTAALNQLSTMFFNNTFWEGGLVSNSVTPTGFAAAGPGQHLNAGRPGSHLFAFQDTGAGGQSGMGETWDIQSYNYRLYDTLFPNLFRDRLSAEIQAVSIIGNHNGVDLYSPQSGDPFITFGNSTDTTTTPVQPGTDSRPPQPGVSQWLDSPSKFVLQWYAYATINNDTGLLQEAWPAIKDQIAFLKGTIAPGTALPDDPTEFANIYDGIPQSGPGVYDSELYLLALTMGIAAGQQLGTDPAYVAGLQNDLAAAKQQFELLLWDPVQHYYRFSSVTGGAFKLIDTFFAQHIAEDLGLPDLVDPAHHLEQLTNNQDSALRYNSAGQLIGPELESTIVPNEGAGGVWIPSAYMAAADYVEAAKRYNDPELKDYALNFSQAMSSQIWLNQDNGFAFDPPQFWSASSTSDYTYPAYSQFESIWDLMNSIKPLVRPSA